MLEVNFFIPADRSVSIFGKLIEILLGGFGYWKKKKLILRVWFGLLSSLFGSLLVLDDLITDQAG